MTPRLVQIVLFVSIMALLTGGIHYYLWARLVRDPSLPAPWRTVATVGLWSLFVLMFASFFLARYGGVLRPIVWIPYVWMGAMFYLFLLVVLGDVLRGALGRTDDPERRLALYRAIASGVAVLGGGLSLLALRGGLLRPRTVDVAVPVTDLDPALVGLTMVQLTDVHVGPTIGKEFIEHLVERCNALNPDVIAITGDLVDGSVAELGAAVAPLGKLRARHGVYFVTGNHEYYSGALEWVAELSRLGLRVLRNERLRLEHNGQAFELAGVDDYTARGQAPGHGHDADKALGGRDRSLPCILLAHQPRSVIDAAAHGVTLQLSGHTHGGQLWPWGYAVKLQQPYVVGLCEHEGTQVYVSRGTGYWGPPMRLGAPSEISRIVLARRS